MTAPCPDWTANDWQDVADACAVAAAESWRFAAQIENADPAHAARVRAYGDRRAMLAEDARNVRRAMDAAR